MRRSQGRRKRLAKMASGTIWRYVKQITWRASARRCASARACRRTPSAFRARAYWLQDLRIIRCRRDANGGEFLRAKLGHGSERWYRSRQINYRSNLALRDALSSALLQHGCIPKRRVSVPHASAQKPSFVGLIAAASHTRSDSPRSESLHGTSSHTTRGYAPAAKMVAKASCRA